MSLMQAPVGIILLRRTAIQERLDRNQHPRGSEVHLPRPFPLMAIRTGLGRIFVELGTRLAPDHATFEPASGRLATSR